MKDCEHTHVVEHMVANRFNGNDIEIIWCEDCGAIKAGVRYLWRKPKHTSNRYYQHVRREKHD